MKNYKVSIGNRTTRPGHRQDCAQVRLELHVVANTPRRALRLAKDWAREGCDHLGGPQGFPVKISVGNLTLRDVTEETP